MIPKLLPRQWCLLCSLLCSCLFTIAQPTIRLGTSGEFDWTQNNGKEAIIKCGDIIYIPLNATPTAGVSSANFTFNVTYVNSGFAAWQVSGDLKTVSSNANSITVVSADVQDRGVTALNYSQSIGRITLFYKTEKCNESCYFDVYKKYNDRYIPAISGPSCLAPLRQYSFCVDPLATDNLSQQIGMDRYFWTVPPGCTIDGYSNDSSRITITTAAGYNGGKIQCCFGLCNQYSSQGVLSASPTCTTAGLNLAIVAPTVTVSGGSASPGVVSSFPASVCVATNAVVPYTTPLHLSVAPIAGYTYFWSWPAMWGGTPPFTGSSLNLTVNNNPGDVVLTSVSPCGETRTDVISLKRVLSAALFPVPACTAPGFSFIVGGGNDSRLNLADVAAFKSPFSGMPAGWSASYNNYGEVQVNTTTAPGNYSISISNSCTAPFAIPVSVKPAITTITPGSCVPPGATATLSTSATTGVNYTWTMTGGSGYSCSGCGTNVPNSAVTITGGTGGTSVSVLQTVIGSSPVCNTSAVTSNLTEGIAPPGLPSLSCTALTQPSNINTFVTPVAGASTYSWNVSPTSFGSLSGLVTTTPSLNFAANGNAGTITVTCSASNGNCVSIPVSATFNLGLTPAPFNLSAPVYFPVNPPDPAYAELDVTGTGPGNINGGTNTTNYTWYNCTSGNGYGAGSILPNSPYRINPTNGNSSWLLATPAPGVNTVYGAQMSKNGCVYRQCVSVTGYQNMLTPHNGTGAFDQETWVPMVVVSPNPNTGNFVVTLSNSNESGMVEILQMNETPVSKRAIVPGYNHLQLNDLPSGVYQLRFEIAGFQRYEKMVVVR